MLFRPTATSLEAGTPRPVSSDTILSARACESGIYALRVQIGGGDVRQDRVGDAADRA
jgi:hypothetical protein